MSFDELNSLGKEREPFLVISDFRAKNIKVISLSKLKESDIEFCMDENYIFREHKHSLIKHPLSFEEYKKKFDLVIEQIKAGNTYLLNLTQSTIVDTPLSLGDIYKAANAKFKIRYKDEFVCFSPERFISIKGCKINAFPMKGTIDASLPNAKETILDNKKEAAEHTMVVDLLRNDLSMVAKNVRVKSFRYITQIDSGAKKLLQVSSHISGDLDESWHENIGEVLKKLLPAGSISGTPKRSTLNIIDEVEEYERGYFSGIFGVYDGESFDSAVMIRFIEKTKEGYIYKSGGGITLDSDAKSEYNELLDKVYIP